MGNLEHIAGCARDNLKLRAHLDHAGFANTQLLITLAILFAVGLLLQLQACESLSFGGGGGGASRKASANKRASKAPALIPPKPQERVLAQAAEKFISQRSNDIARIDKLQRETVQAYAHMDGRRAAQILAEMDPALVVEILAKLRERDIARILEEAEPADAATWTAALLQRPEFTPVPDALKPAAARAGVYDDLPDLLSQVSPVPADAASTEASTNTDNQTGAALPSDTTPEEPGAEATPAPDAGSTASPAANPPPPGDATTDKPPAESLV